MNRIDLTQINKGESVKVIEINGGQKFKERVEAIGLREGSQIIKLSTQFLSGPITIKIGRIKLAIGQGMARKIFVDGKNK